MAVIFDDNIKRQVQQANDIVDVISEHLNLDKKGKEYVGVCPFHQDHRPSMYVSPEMQIFKCFACGAGGDAFKFIQLREGLSFPDAVERLANRAGIQLKQRAPRRRAPAQDGQGYDDQGYDDGYATQADAKSVARANAWAQKYWQSCFNDEQKGKIAREYLKDRQISDESIKTWGIGLALDQWQGLIDVAKKKNIPDKLLIDSGLAVSKETGRLYDKFRNRVMFPILDVTSRVIGFGGRTLGDDPAKYMNSPTTSLFDKSNSMYGLYQARHEIVKSGTAVVVEGYTDVIMCHQHGCKNVVATLGTSFTQGHAAILRRYAKRIVLLFDSDIAGTEAANRALEVCLSQKIDIKLAFVTDGKDPCDFMISSGPEAFENLIENAVDVMEFKWQRLIDGLDGSDNIADRKKAAEEYLRAVAIAMQSSSSVDPIAEGLIGGQLSKIIGLSEQATRDYLHRFTARLNRAQSHAVQNQRVVSYDMGSGYYAKAQQEILEVLLNEPKFFEEIDGLVTVQTFDVPILREIAQAIFDVHANGGHITPATVLSGIESVQAGSAAVELAEVGRKKGNFQSRFEDAMGVFKKRQLDAQAGAVKQQMNNNETESLHKIYEILNSKGRSNKANPGFKPV